MTWALRNPPAFYGVVLALFNRYKLPLAILTPPPLNVIGIVFAYGLFDAAVTATSMNDFIALPGIILALFQRPTTPLVIRPDVIHAADGAGDTRNPSGASRPACL